MFLQLNEYARIIFTPRVNGIFLRLQGLGDEILDLIDYCVVAVARLIAKTDAPITSTSSLNDRETAALASIDAWRADLRTNIGLSCVSILRFMTDHADKLSFSALSRLYNTHDIPMLMVPLIENPPWVRKRKAEGKGKGVVWEKLIDRVWKEVPQSDLLKLSPLEAQPWLCLYNSLQVRLTCLKVVLERVVWCLDERLTRFYSLQEPEVRKIYHINTHRVAALQRVRKYINDLLVDQLPMLVEMQRSLDEMSLISAPEPSGMRAALLQAIPVVEERLLADACAALAKESSDSVLVDGSGTHIHHSLRLVMPDTGVYFT